MLITLLQLTQMVIGCWVNIKAWEYTTLDKTCHVTKENVKVSLIMYATYFILFAHFFIGSYIFKTKRGSAQNEKKQQVEYENNQHAKKLD